MPFLPTTKNELRNLGWDRLDVILVSGDSYIDSPYMGTAVMGRVLSDAGFRVGIIAQPDVSSGKDITRLGLPRLFWGVTAGAVDSMVANYTATGKPRQSDDYTPGGINNRRPDRAVIVYTNLIKRHFKGSRIPIVLGGIEASLRRISHYDFTSDSIRRSILFDSKADLLVYGMGEKSAVGLARAMDAGTDYRDIRGICYISGKKPDEYIELPSYENVLKDKQKFIECFHTFYRNIDPVSARGLVQRHQNRYLVHNPPSHILSERELDRIYELDFERDLHPFYKKGGDVRALDTIRFSIPTHRGCYGECNFCAIAVHEGRTVQSRSIGSIVRAAEQIAGLPDFKGYISDVGGPTANMYGFECRKKREKGSCTDRRCLFPEICPNLRPDHSRQIELLTRLRQMDGIKKVFVASGLRYDLLFNDKRHCIKYLEEIVSHHVSGQMKVAPEHTQKKVLDAMGKPDADSLLELKTIFDRLSTSVSKKQFLTYYLMAAHPGCTLDDMRKLKSFANIKLRITPEQIQIFTPTPSTYSTLMYHTGLNPFTGEEIFVEKTLRGKEKQKSVIRGER
ncbi:MAG: YgiQ family radical SAM protein [Deltaproteobacteria bacterium]|nr:YgiQ family radical SAM protein [Deltaproteobacteria bacterium]